jgi:hypothetical protein
VTKTRTMIWYGLCTFWTEDWPLLARTAHGIPCCPHCGAVGFQINADDWWAGVERYESEGNPGYRAFLEDLRNTCHGKSTTVLSLWGQSR